MKPYWLLPVSELDGLAAATVTQRASVEARFGESLGYELISQETVGDSLLRFTYLEKNQMHGLRWVFRFYKPRDSWTINSIHWDDSIELLFEE